MNKANLYFENSRTNEITDDSWQADMWADAGIDIICWRWSDVCECWLDYMVREGK